MLIEVAASGCHVVTEKPMATRWHDGVRIVKACDEANVHLFVVKQNRRNPPLQLLKNAIDEHRFGKIYTVNVNVFWTRPQEFYDSACWRGTWGFDGDAFMNQASHYIELLDWLIGPTESVQVYTVTLDRQIEVEDTGFMSVKWRSGALGSVNVTMLTYPKNIEGSITILGEKGTVGIGGVAINEIQQWEFETPNKEDETIQHANYYEFAYASLY
jgi:UDP-N-acetyl-2-amino-2-deoxyglucuronate dehydrogenase